MGVKNSRPTTPPSKGTHSVEPSASSSPAHGQGLYHQFLDRFGDDIRIGRVDDLYGSYLCANVTVHGRISNLPCLWLEAAAGRWMGAKTFSPPPIGTSVAVWMPQDAKFGVILGTINPPNRTEIYVPTQLGYTALNMFDPTSKQNAEQWEMQGFMINSGMGVPQDIFPGDSVTTNEVHAAMGMLKFLSVVRGGENSRIEAYAWDDLLRIISHNFQHRLAGAEQEVMVDYGEIDDIIERTISLAEGLGQDPIADQAAAAAAEENDEEAPAPVDGDVGRWRHRRFFGKLAHLLQDFICRPHSGAAVLPENPEEDVPKPDLGVRQNAVEMGGYEVTRTVTGVRIHKCRQIAVPKRKRYPDDIDGESKPPEREALKPFEFKKGPGPIGRMAQLRDEAAYLYNKLFPQRFLEKKKDWDVPDEATCPAIAVDNEAAPQIGGFYREYPQMFAVSGEINANGAKFNSDAADDPRVTAQGDAFIDLNDDGSVTLKDNWGSAVSMHGGHIIISASKDVQIFAGGSLINLAGDDFIAKARNSMDLTTSKGQFRIYAAEDVFVHSKNGGMLFSLDARGYKYTHKEGENRKLAGILFKCGTPQALGGFQVKASNATFSLDNGGSGAAAAAGGMFYVGPVDLKGSRRPDFVQRVRGAFNWMGTKGNVGFEIWKQEPKGYVQFYDGGIFNSDRIHSDGRLEIRKDGIFGGGVSENADWSRVKTLAELVEEAGTFKESLWSQFPYPYKDDDIKKVDFTFRESKDYGTATEDAAWVETFWQRDLRNSPVGELTAWKDAEHTDKSRPYPGKDKFEKSWWTYEEVNLDRYGRPKNREEISSTGGNWSQTSWDNLKVHPDR